MLTTSAAFKTAIASEDREIRAYLKFNGSTILRGVDGLVSIEWDQSVYDEERLCIGCAVSSFITAEFFDNLTGVDFKNSYVEAFVGVVLEDTGTAPSGSIEPDTATVEYVSLGRFDITDSVTKNGKTVITAYDKLSKLSGEYTPSISAGTNGYAIADIVNDVLTQSGVGGSVSGSYGYVQKIQASTYREQLKYCLTMMVQNGSSYILDRTNDSLKMTSVIGQDATQLTITDSTTYMDGMDEQPSFTISSLQATTGTDVYTFGNGQGIEISNPYITNAQASAIYNSMEGFSYLPIRLEFRGNPAIDPGDVLTLTAGGKNTKIVAMRIRSTFNGGFKSTIDCYGNTETYYAMSESPTGTRITQAENMIRLEAERATTAEGNLSAQITINADAISSEVTRATAAEGALSASITQTAGEVSIVAQKLNNIGGRNILLNSATVHWEAINSATVSHTDGVSVSEWGCDDAIRATGTGGQTAIMLQLLYTSQTAATLLADRKYVMSCWIKNNSAMTLRLAANNGTSDEIAPGEQKRAVVYADGDGSSALRLRLATQQPGEAFDFIYWHPQIEYGEVVTSWNPAPEDTEGAIAANSAAIQVNATNIASKVSQTDYNGNTIASLINQTSTSVQIQASKVDLQGYVTFTNLSTSGQTAIDGANITTGTISADRIGANSITAAKINLTDLFSQNITATNFNLTGGSINVTAASASTNVISLQNGDHHSTMQPVGFAYYNGSTGDRYELNRYGFYSYKDVNTSTSGNSYALGYWSGASIVLGATNSAIQQAGSVYINGSQNEIRLSALGSDGSIRSYNGDYSKYSAAIWPDGNGAGRLMLGDGTGAIWRTSLTNDGLTFRNTSNIALASYETGGFSFTNAAGVLRAKLDSNGLAFYYGASNGMSAFYPASGAAQVRGTAAANGGTQTITFSGSTLAIIGALGSTGATYGMWTYTGYGAGTARQHITAINGPGSGVTCTINTDQSVTVTNTTGVNCGIYVWVMAGNTMPSIA